MAVACFFTGLFLLLCINCASSNTGRALNAGVAFSGGLDVVSGQQAIDRGGVEVNPVMGSSAWQQAAVKAAGVTIVIAVANWLERRHPVLAHVLRSITITGWSVAAGYNWSVTPNNH